MENYKKKKLSIFAIFAIIFAVIGVICFIGNLINFLKTISYYVSQGYPLGDVLSEMLYSSIYQILQPLAGFGGVSLLLFALNSIIERLPVKCGIEAAEPHVNDRPENLKP